MALVDLADGFDGVAPNCWYINHRRYGQITMREDEAIRAAQDGTLVYAYSHAVLVTPNPADVAVKVPPNPTKCQACGHEEITTVCRYCKTKKGPL